MKPIKVNQYNGNSFSATSCFNGGIVSGHSRDTVSPRITVVVDSQSSYMFMIFGFGTIVTSSSPVYM